MKAKAFTRKIFELIKSNWYMPVKSMHDYSETEQKVGHWVTGVPVYEKTLFDTTPSAVTPIGTSPAGDQLKYIPIGAEIDNVVSYHAYVNLNGGSWAIMPMVSNTIDSFGKINIRDHTNVDTPDTAVCLISDSNWINRPLRITLRYTKVGEIADTDIVPFNPLVEYSLKEQMVGYWINRKPLYRKTINFGALPAAAGKTVTHNILHIETVADVAATAVHRYGEHSIPVPFTYDDGGAIKYINVSAGNAAATMRSNIDLSTDYPESYVTISYTKTTDY